MDILTIDYTDINFNDIFVKSLHNTGFAVVDNHPINQQLINKVYDDWKKFFSSDKKHNYLFDYEKQDGYFPYKSENAQGYKTKDLKEFFHIYRWGRYPSEISEITKLLHERNVISDLREPNVLRVAPVPLYNSFEDCYNFVQILKNIFNECR